MTFGPRSIDFDIYADRFEEYDKEYVSRMETNGPTGYE